MNGILKIKQKEDQKVYFTSDLHLNHNPKWKVPLWEMRGFTSAKHHTDFIIDKINELVRPNDILINNGDLCLNTEESGFNELLARIQCQNMYLLWGNHNNPVWKVYQREVVNKTTMVGVEIYPFRYKNIIFVGNYLEFTVDGHYFVAAHYPIHVFNYMKDGAMMLCGHSHYALPFSKAENLENKILDLGWDGYNRPLSLTEVLEIMDKKSIFVPGDHHKKKENNLTFA